jgi:cell division transport system permease protein
VKGWLARLRYCVVDAAEEWRHSPGVNLLATATLGAAVFVAGITLLLLFNVGARIREWREDVRVSVYLEDGVSTETTRRLKRRLEGIPGIESVSYVDKAEALTRFRETFGESAALAEKLPQNPLPASLEARLVHEPGSAEVAKAVAAAISSEEGVEEVRFDQEWIDRLDASLALARKAGLGLGVVVFGAVAFVMSSVMRLAVYARREEVEIMLLVGATPMLVRGPFLAAGLFQGLAGSAAAVAIVAWVRRLLLSLFEPPPALLDLVVGRALPPALVLALVLSGLVVSCASAYFAARGPASQKS